MHYGDAFNPLLLEHGSNAFLHQLNSKFMFHYTIRLASREKGHLRQLWSWISMCSQRAGQSETALYDLRFCVEVDSLKTEIIRKTESDTLLKYPNVPFRVLQAIP